jgi:hypothetical protein
MVRPFAGMLPKALNWEGERPREPKLLAGVN